MDEFGQRLNDPVGPFNEGSHLNLICEAEGGKQSKLNADNMLNESLCMYVCMCDLHELAFGVPFSSI